ncbi:MAG: response regulator [Rhizobiales bacterium]|nr:response regulator [Hyphomicrobiales bacterium]
MKFCMVIDDSDVIRKVGKRLIERLSMVALDAANAGEALEKCRVERPDYVLVDRNLPGDDTHDLIRALKALDEDGTMNVIYCITENDTKSIVSAFSAGADDYLLKPLDLTSLATKIQNIEALRELDLSEPEPWANVQTA